MKDLILRLQNEANLSKDQAHNAIGIFRDYLIECEDDPDLAEVFKVKVSHIRKTAKSQYENLTDQAKDLMTKAGETITEAGDKTDELLSKIKRKTKVAVDKFSDYLDDKKDK